MCAVFWTVYLFSPQKTQIISLFSFLASSLRWKFIPAVLISKPTWTQLSSPDHRPRLDLQPQWWNLRAQVQRSLRIHQWLPSLSEPLVWPGPVRSADVLQRRRHWDARCHGTGKPLPTSLPPTKIFIRPITDLRGCHVHGHHTHRLCHERPAAGRPARIRQHGRDVFSCHLHVFELPAHDADPVSAFARRLSLLLCAAAGGRGHRRGEA